MEKKQKFDSVKERTLECLRRVVLVDENRRNEIDAWLDEAIDSGDLELYFMEREGRSVEELSSVAKQLRAGFDPETIKEGIISGSLNIGNIIIGDETNSIGESEQTGEDKTVGEPTEKTKESMTLKGVSHDTRHWRTMIDYNYESEFGDMASFRISVSRWSIPDQKRREKEKKHNEQVAKIVEIAENKAQNNGKVKKSNKKEEDSTF